MMMSELVGWCINVWKMSIFLIYTLFEADVTYIMLLKASKAFVRFLNLFSTVMSLLEAF